MKRRKIGIIGAGVIGKAILADVLATGFAEVEYVAFSSEHDAPDLGSYNGTVLTDVDEALARPVDLLIEAAVPEVLARVAPVALRWGNVCGFSCAALAAPDIEDAVRKAASSSGNLFFVPHGAALALDGLADGRQVIEAVSVTTTKSGKSLGLAHDIEGVIFEGSARHACGMFPRNVNVHAAVALAGIGFDRTTSRVVAVPGQTAMEHRLEVSGPGFAWDIRISSQSLGGVTGTYTPRSAIGSVRRILAHDGLTVA